MSQKRILMIVGSQRAESFSRQLAEEAAQLLDGRAEVSFLNYADVPFLNQDEEYPAPEAVARVRAEVEAADGLWIFTPEYNGSYPGQLKNLLDWLSRPLRPFDFAGGTTIGGKRVAVSGAAGKSAAAYVLKNLTELLQAIRTEPMTEPQVGVELAGEAFMTNKLGLTDADRERLRAQADAFLASIEA